MEVKSVFARNLEYYLSIEDKKRVDMYNALGIDKSTACRWFQNTIPTMKTVERIADYLNVPMSALLEERTENGVMCITESYAKLAFQLQDMKFDSEKFDSLIEIAKIMEKMDSQDIERLLRIANVL